MGTSFGGVSDQVAPDGRGLTPQYGVARKNRTGLMRIALRAVG